MPTPPIPSNDLDTWDTCGISLPAAATVSPIYALRMSIGQELRVKGAALLAEQLDYTELVDSELARLVEISQKAGSRLTKTRKARGLADDETKYRRYAEAYGTFKELVRQMKNAEAELDRSRQRSYSLQQAFRDDMSILDVPTRSSVEASQKKRLAISADAYSQNYIETISKFDDLLHSVTRAGFEGESETGESEGESDSQDAGATEAVDQAVMARYHE